MHISMLLSLIFTIATFLPCVNGQQKTVFAGNYVYRGVVNETAKIISFYGIPYAHPPIGDLRWRPPVVKDTGSELTEEFLFYDASNRGPQCIQSFPPWSTESAFDSLTTEAEDCLRLDILAPKNPASEKLPVMVQIHGGGYVSGNTSSSPGASLVYQANGKLIYVAIQYRLGPLGFLAGDEVAASGSWNVGLLDQRAALDWVRKNIEFFGGDPEKITVIGESAGGASAGFQMMLKKRSDLPWPDMKNTIAGSSLTWMETGGFNGFDFRDPTGFPFRAAIMESPWWSPMMNKDQLNKQYQLFLREADCSTLDCLRKAPISAIKLATESSYNISYNDGDFAYGTYYWGPAMDGKVIPEHPMQAFKENHVLNIPIMINHARDEGFEASNVSMTTEAEVATDLEILWRNKSFVTDALKNYPTTMFNKSVVEALDFVSALRKATGSNISFSDEFARLESLLGEAFVNCPTRFIASAVSRRGLDTFKMIFDAGSQIHGATHPFLFSDTVNASGEITHGPITLPGNEKLAALLRTYFITFTIYADPNEGPADDERRVRPIWRRYLETKTDNKKILVLRNSTDPASTTRIDDPDDNNRCAFFESSSAYLEAI
ncbi:hypothetical protein PFICI_14783 [Pestalotiopsis fici W106-1]|uniref:Carboxylic ester hydrolase n=1 Tax=Pestalotiopsis fici (strain W106-1 / CGMCC3.15140) TaxID=1229662 RepID=W3WL11_PESFW|nr:uncharacterized protein PFICI_14783 [Pestalotiopsis fici W106-1]ETS73837.1 hypothetical protein PFICI_14783 [Pestalotiopsis fici W106-1]